MGIVECGASTDRLESYQIPGYQTFCLKRSRQIASGIIIYVKGSLTAEVLTQRQMSSNDKHEALKIRVWNGPSDYHIAFVYNPPLNNPKLDDLLYDWNKNSIILGDFNAPSRRWGYSNNNSVGNAIEEFIDSNPIVFIENISKSPTFLSFGGKTSHPDLLLTHPSLEKNITHKLNDSPGGAGHQILLTSINRRHAIYRAPQIKLWNLKKANWTEFARMTDLITKEPSLDLSIDRNVKEFTSTLLKCASYCVPRGKIKKYAPFWNSDLQKMKEDRNKARNLARKTNQMVDCVKLRKCQAILKRTIKKSKRITFQTFLEKLDFRRDGVKAHGFLSRLNNQKETKNEPIRSGAKILVSAKEKANAFCKHYANISNFQPRHKIRNSQLNPPENPNETSEFHSLFYEDFTMSELDIGLNGLVKGKSPGPDGILPEFLIYLGPKAKNIFLSLINITWRKGLPSIWRKAEVIPVLKPKKDPQYLSSYRPISLTSTMCKVTERLVSNRLIYVLDKKKILTERQAGFRKHHNTSEQIIRLSQEIKDGFHRKHSTLAVFVDFRTAFDTVWRKRLLTKLIAIGIHGHIFKWIKSFLDQRLIRIKFENETSGFRQIRQGLPQGSVLSPMLFNIMINDFADALSKHEPGVQTLLFADDLVIWTTGKDFGCMEKQLQSALLFLENWSEKNEMTVNPDKTTFQLFSLSTKHHDINLNYMNKCLKRTETTTYLGVELDSKLKWTNQVDKAIIRGENRSKLLKRLTGTTWGSTQDVLCTAYKTYVRPAVEYGAEALITTSETNSNRLDVFQNRIMRLITGGTKSTPINAMELQSGLEPLSDRRWRMALNLTETILRREDNFLSHYWPAQERLRTHRTFLSFIKEIHDTIDFPTSPRLPFLEPCYPLKNYRFAEGYLELISRVGKKTSLDIELKSLALATIHERFPSIEWLHVYTDGSAEGAIKNAGAGAFSKDFNLCSAIGKHFDNFDGELAAISLAIDKIEQSDEENVVIFVDSRAAILAVTALKNGNCDISRNCVVKIDNLFDKKKRIALQWIPSHCGIYGNDQADILAKRGAQMIQPDPPLSYRHIKQIIRRAIGSNRLNYYVEQSAGRKWNTLLNKTSRIPGSLPRAVGVACFRLSTGHDYLQGHLHRIGLTPSDICPLCDLAVPMTDDHIYNCPAVADCIPFCLDVQNFFHRSFVYWAARRLMAELPETGIC